MKIGEYSISSIVPTTFRLDGGAMFGSVPKVLWSQKIAADTDNCIPLCCRVLVLEAPGRKILVDMGSGRKWNEKKEKIYNFSYHPAGALHELIPDVTDVIVTHLHFDHVGGVSYFDPDGNPVLSYPNARYHIQRANWEIARAPGVRERATYLAENVEPLVAANLHLIDGDTELFPGIEVFRSDGHTLGLQWVKISDDTTTLVCPSELVPSAHHIQIPYVMGYDLHAALTLEDKEKLISAAVQHKWILFFGHDVDTAACTLAFDERGRATVDRKWDIQQHC